MEQLPHPTPSEINLFYGKMNDLGLTFTQATGIWEQMRSYTLQAVALERERCARICDKRANFLASALENEDKHQWMREEAELCAAAIRKG